MAKLAAIPPASAANDRFAACLAARLRIVLHASICADTSSRCACMAATTGDDHWWRYQSLIRGTIRQEVEESSAALLLLRGRRRVHPHGRYNCIGAARRDNVRLVGAIETPRATAIRLQITAHACVCMSSAPGRVLMHATMASQAPAAVARS